MQTRPWRSPWATLPFVALLIVGCISTGQPPTGGPSASLPGEGPTGPLATIPGETPTATATPEPGTTSAPTDVPSQEPTDGPHPDWPPGAISAGDAVDHVGEQATVCGTVDTARWLFDEPGHPTWLNFNRPYPTMRFNAVIWGEQRRAWPESGKPEVVYPGKGICVTGLVEGYDTWVQIQDLTITDILLLP